MSDSERTSGKVCLYIQKLYDSSTICSRFDDKTNRYAFCDKLEQFGSRCFKKHEKESQLSTVFFNADEVSSAGPPPTVDVTLLELNNSPA